MAGKPPAKGEGKKDSGEKLIAENRKARHDYHISDPFEAGIMLQGTEVKSLRAGRVTLADSYAMVMHGELWLMNCDIQVYSHGNLHNHEPKRRRKLLAHRNEIDKLEGKVHEKGFTIVPLKLYWKNGKAKVLLGLGKGKKEFDRREDIKAREDRREADRALRRGNR